MKITKKSRSRFAADESKLCQFPFADGRQCRMLRSKTHPSLCVFHARDEEQLASFDSLGDELASCTGTFRTVTDINHVIGRLFKLVACNRIPLRNAKLLAHLAQLLLHSHRGVKQELRMSYQHDEYERLARSAYQDAYRRSQPPSAPPTAAQLPAQANSHTSTPEADRAS